MIELIGVDKSYHGRRILSGASLTIERGESVALVGANGSGKTTTLRCVVGLARPDAGQVRIDGIDGWTRQREARARVSYLAQRTEFPPTLTVREILRVVADLRGAPSRAVEREIALCGLARVAGRTARTLSGGERQRVAMAALFVPEVHTYLLDEPTLNLDPIGSRLLVDRLRSFGDDGRSVLFTTHVNSEFDELATRVVMLEEGRFVAVPGEAAAGERHVSIAVGDRSDVWADTAVRAGATRAWHLGGRLHAIVADTLLSGVLAQLAREGASVSAFRAETALGTALDRLSAEEQNLEAAPAGRVDRCVAADDLWRQARWARADSAGPR